MPSLVGIGRLLAMAEEQLEEHGGAFVLSEVRDQVVKSILKQAEGIRMLGVL